MLGQGIGRIGCDVFGKAMASPLPWGIKYQGQLVHPAQVYELILDYLVFFMLWRKRKNVKYDGQLFLWYVILFAINRGVVELFRTNPVIIGWFSVAHLLSLLFIIGTLIVMYFVKKSTLGVLANSSPAIEKSRGSLIKDIFILLVLTVVSIFIFYTVQS